MISKQSIKSFISGFSKKPTRVLQDPQLMHPKRDWLIGLGVALFIFLGSAALSTYTFIQNRTKVAPVAPQENAIVYRESLVAEVLAEIKDREQTLNALVAQEEQAEVFVEIEEATTSDAVLVDTPSASTTDERAAE